MLLLYSLVFTFCVRALVGAAAAPLGLLVVFRAQNGTNEQERERIPENEREEEEQGERKSTLEAYSECVCVHWPFNKDANIQSIRDVTATSSPDVATGRFFFHNFVSRLFIQLQLVPAIIATLIFRR